MAGETELVISGDGMPPTAVRGISETLEPVDNPQFDKYRLTLQCSDKNAPAFDRLRVGNFRRTVNGGFVDLSGMGSIVTVDCISELAFRTGGSPAAIAQRPAVAGSIRESDGYTFYRPQLIVGLVRKSQETDEYGAVVAWSADFEEI